MVVLLLLLMIVVMPFSARAAWSDGASLAGSPEEVFNGQQVTFSFTLTIAAVDGMEELNITEVTVQFDWETQTLFAGDNGITSFPAVLSYEATTTVPSDLESGTHQAVLAVTAMEKYATEPSTSRFTHSFVSSEALGVSASADRTAVTAPGTVGFSASITGGTGPYEFAWSFGDGGTGSGQTTSYTYSTAGSYSAQVTVTDAYGMTASGSTATITVNQPPIVSIAATPNSGTAPLTVGFTASPSYGTAPYTYAWSFGDGGTSSDASPSHIYSNAGTYDVYLTLQDSSGQTATSSTVRITVSAAPGFAASASASVTSGTAPLSVEFTSATSNGQAPYTYSWDFGDGTTSSEATPTHVYSSSGRYDVYLTVTDSAGKVATTSALTIVVSDAPAIEISVSATPTSGLYPLTVSFNSSVVNASGAVTYAWDFGDGSSSSEASPEHIYQASGIYEARLTVVDELGRSGSAMAEIVVTSENAPVVFISKSAASGAAPFEVKFESEATGGTLPLSYRWDFGDGTHAAGAAASHVFNETGVYKVRLTVTDSDNRIGVSNEIEITVSEAQPRGVASSLDWTLVILISVVVAYLAAGLLLARPWK